MCIFVYTSPIHFRVGERKLDCPWVVCSAVGRVQALVRTEGKMGNSAERNFCPTRCRNGWKSNTSKQITHDRYNTVLPPVDQSIPSYNLEGDSSCSARNRHVDIRDTILHYMERLINLLCSDQHFQLGPILARRTQTAVSGSCSAYTLLTYLYVHTVIDCWWTVDVTWASAKRNAFICILTLNKHSFYLM